MEYTESLKLWEEKNLIELEKKNSPPNENVQNDTTRETKNELIKNQCKNIGSVSGIYKIINKINGKYYIGSSKNIHIRWTNHKSRLNTNKHHNTHLQNAWIKYGEYNFDFIICEQCDPHILLETEQKYLDIVTSNRDSCYNKSFIASGIEMTTEARYKMSLRKLGKYIADKNPAYKNIDLKLIDEFKLYWIKNGQTEFKKYIKIKYNYGGTVARRLIKRFNEDLTASDQRKKLYNQLRKETCHANKEKRIMSGTSNPRYNHTIYTFYNLKSEQTFCGTVNEIVKKYRLASTIYSVARGQRKSYKGWVVNPSHILSQCQSNRHYNYDHNIYNFFNTKTQEKYNGTSQDFSRKYLLSYHTARNLILKKTKISKTGWIIIFTL